MLQHLRAPELLYEMCLRAVCFGDEVKKYFCIFSLQACVALRTLASHTFELCICEYRPGSAGAPWHGVRRTPNEKGEARSMVQMGHLMTVSVHSCLRTWRRWWQREKRKAITSLFSILTGAASVAPVNSCLECFTYWVTQFPSIHQNSLYLMMVYDGY